MDGEQEGEWVKGIRNGETKGRTGKRGERGTQGEGKGMKRKRR
jgi:hypothetical protein